MLGGKTHVFADSNPLTLFEIMGSPEEHYFNSVGLQTPVANVGTVNFGTTAASIFGQLIPDRSTLMPVKDMKSVHVKGIAGQTLIFIFF